MSRLYQLTGKGRLEAKQSKLARNEVLDYLYENKTASYSELTSLLGVETIGNELSRLKREGYICEVGSY